MGSLFYFQPRLQLEEGRIKLGWDHLVTDLQYHSEKQPDLPWAGKRWIVKQKWTILGLMRARFSLWPCYSQVYFLGKSEELSTTFLICNRRKGERNPYFRGCGEASHEIIYVKGSEPQNIMQIEGSYFGVKIVTKKHMNLHHPFIQRTQVYIKKRHRAGTISGSRARSNSLLCSASTAEGSVMWKVQMPGQ